MRRSMVILILSLVVFPIQLFADSPIYKENQTQITTTVKQLTFIIKLTANPTTGYNWSVNYDKNYLNLIRYQYESSYDPSQKFQKVGAPGVGVWTFKIVPQQPATARSQTTQIKFSYQRPWEKQPVNTLTFNVTLPESSASLMNDAQ